MFQAIGLRSSVLHLCGVRQRGCWSMVGKCARNKALLQDPGMGNWTQAQLSPESPQIGPEGTPLPALITVIFSLSTSLRVQSGFITSVLFLLHSRL